MQLPASHTGYSASTASHYLDTPDSHANELHECMQPNPPSVPAMFQEFMTAHCANMTEIMERLFQDPNAKNTGWLKCYITLFLCLITVKSWQKHQQYPTFLHCRGYSKKSSPTELILLGYSECTTKVKNVGYCWCFCHDLTVINQKKGVI